MAREVAVYTVTEAGHRRFSATLATADETAGCYGKPTPGEALAGLPGLKGDPRSAAHRAIGQIAELLPTQDEWQSAAGTVEAIAEILDRHGIERPDHYDEETDIR